MTNGGERDAMKSRDAAGNFTPIKLENVRHVDLGGLSLGEIAARESLKPQHKDTGNG